MAAHVSLVLVDAVVVDDTLQFTLDELARACHAPPDELVALVLEGVLQPSGSGPGDWLFAGPSLGRARSALRLARDLELGVAGAALALDLLDEVARLRARLRRAGLD